MSDSEAVTVSSDKLPDDLMSISSNMIDKIPFKLLSFIFIIYLFLSSDVFNVRILSTIDGAVGYANTPSTKGTIITGVLLVVFTTLVGLLIDKKVI